MQTVVLGTTKKETSVVGFGCAGLMRPTSTAERFAILRTAFDSGLRHFDTARYYGHGGSEGVLGEFIQRNRLRQQVTIATKFGIEPTPIGKSASGKRLMQIARQIVAFFPPARRVLAQIATRTTRTDCFSPEKASVSLETSLRELRTDYLDLFLLHDVTRDSAQTDGLLKFLTEAQASGKILAFGCATDVLSILGILSESNALTSFIQMANSLSCWNVPKLPNSCGSFVSTHGALRELTVLERVFAESKIKDVYTTARGAELAGLLLGLSVHKNPQGITLFSSTRPDRVRENVKYMLKCQLGADGWSDFQRIAESHLTRVKTCSDSDTL